MFDRWSGKVSRALSDKPISRLSDAMNAVLGQGEIGWLAAKTCTPGTNKFRATWGELAFFRAYSGRRTRLS
jgi:hypothetical protein